jgi:hypothetical protein
MSRSSSLLHRESSRTRVFQFTLKLAEERRQLVHVASSRKSHRDEAEDGWVNATGCIRLFYPNFAIFFVLDHKGSLVINFPVNRTPRVGGED